MDRPVLQPDLLCQAYSLGYFPMPDPKTGEIMFLRPDPRAVLPLDGFHCSRSLRRRLRQGDFEISCDLAFPEVMEGCADREETWITRDFFEGYTALFDQRMAHSVEVWKGEELAGGLYGVSLGAAFFAESKFHRERDASKVALFYLVQFLKEQGFELLEIQFLTPHLASLGAIEIPDPQYQVRLQNALAREAEFRPRPRHRPIPVFTSTCAPERASASTKRRGRAS